MVAGGHVLIHPPLIEQAALDAEAAGTGGFDFRSMLAGLRPAVSRADLAICHLETPFAGAEGPFLGVPRFAAPPQIALSRNPTPPRPGTRPLAGRSGRGQRLGGGEP